MSTQYHDAHDGLSGNEDVGQMSAWYIMSALGFYQVEPAGARYWFGSPAVKSAQLAVEGGTFNIETQNNSEANKYIQSILLDGKEYTLPYINHCDLKAGSTLTYIMGDKPAKWYTKDVTE